MCSAGCSVADGRPVCAPPALLLLLRDFGLTFDDGREVGRLQRQSGYCFQHLILVHPYSPYGQACTDVPQDVTDAVSQIRVVTLERSIPVCFMILLSKTKQCSGDVQFHFTLSCILLQDHSSPTAHLEAILADIPLAGADVAGIRGKNAMRGVIKEVFQQRSCICLPRPAIETHNLEQQPDSALSPAFVQVCTDEDARCVWS